MSGFESFAIPLYYTTHQIIFSGYFTVYLSPLYCSHDFFHTSFPFIVFHLFPPSSLHYILFPSFSVFPLYRIFYHFFPFCSISCWLFVSSGESFSTSRYKHISLSLNYVFPSVHTSIRFIYFSFSYSSLHSCSIGLQFPL